MITSITIENFKGISEPVQLGLRPITLLFGQNSAGKSSLLHALVYAREVFERHNLDADRTLSAGEHLDLGGFRTFVHDHDLKRTIRLTFGMSLDGIDLPGSADPELDQGLDDEFQAYGSRPQAVEVSLGIGWSESERRPFVCEWTVAYEERSEYDTEPRLVQLARLICDDPARGSRLVDLRDDHEILGGLEPEDSRVSNEPFRYFHYLLNEIREHIQGVGEEGSLGVRLLLDALPLLDRSSAQPLFPLAVQYPSPPVEGDDREQYHRHLQSYTETMKKLLTVQRVLYMFVAGPALLLRDLLSEFRYIGPQRHVPPRDYTPPRLSDPSRWANGMAGWDLLFRRPILVDRISRLLAERSRLNLGYTLEQVEFREFEEYDRLFAAIRSNRIDDLPDVEGLLKRIPTRLRLLFRPTESPGVLLEPADLGVGVSQMIPVLVAALDDQTRGGASLPTQLVAVEHPELNLHPRLQAEIADVFLEGALAEATKGRIFLIETHSDVFTLRLFRRLRDGSRMRAEPTEGDGSGGSSIVESGGNYRDGSGGRFERPVKPTDLGIWYVDRSNGPVSVRQILVDTEGELVNPWPEHDSLFEQDFKEKYS